MANKNEYSAIIPVDLQVCAYLDCCNVCLFVRMNLTSFSKEQSWYSHFVPSFQLFSTLLHRSHNNVLQAILTAVMCET